LEIKKPDLGFKREPENFSIPFLQEATVISGARNRVLPAVAPCYGLALAAGLLSEGLTHAHSTREGFSLGPYRSHRCH
jgi:hypothetical protein